MKKPTVYGTLLKEAMKRTGMNIDELAKASGVSNTGIVYYRNGYRDPTRERMVSIARALNEPITAFFDDEEFINKTPLERDEYIVLGLIDEGHTNLNSMIKNTLMPKSRIDLALQRLRKRGTIKHIRRGRYGEWLLSK